MDKKRKIEESTIIPEEKQEKIGREEKLDLLIKNTISLQKVIMDLASDVNSLNADIKKMLTLFEEANKAFKEGKFQAPAAITGDLPEKINQLIEHNKIIAKGIVLLEDFLKEKISAQTESAEKFQPKPLPEYRPQQ